jgi:pyruvate kinase
MRRHRRAKIVATLGPASASPEMIRALFDEGADMFRLNFSHGSHADHAERVKIIRQIERDVGRPIGILLDLQGPKLRVGEIEGGSVELVTGDAYRLDLSKEPGNQTRAPLPHPEVFAALRAGTDLLLDDGKIRLTVTDCGRDFAQTEIITGGKLSDRKGVNVPQVVLALSPITEKDRKDLDFGLSLGVDWIGLSFVQLPDDVAEARKIIGRRASIMSKLEKPAAIDRLDEIVALSDGIMVARGDLGVELPPEDVPSLQKRIIRASREAGKPVVVATQMLESMISAPAPTRAEASDVATAVYDGADAVMLSAESAAGDYPREAVAMMNRIIERVEQDPNYRAIMEAVELDPEATSSDAITAAAAQVARTVRAAAIVTFTTSGSTSLRAARERPTVPILCLTEGVQTARRLAVAWGVHCVVTQDVTDFNDMVAKSCAVALREEFAVNGQRIVITAGVPFGTPGATNVLRIAWVGT